MNVSMLRGWVRQPHDGWGRLRSAVNPELGLRLSYLLGPCHKEKLMLSTIGPGHSARLSCATGMNFRELITDLVSNRLNP